MFNPTKPFKDTVTNYPKEPSLRIGTTVPKNAVNLAYYYNPTASDAEKIIAAEAPRNTIDHRVEEAYRYLFNQATEDDNLFPKNVYFEDEEGYSGYLGRMFVNWYPQVHIETKNIQKQSIVYVEDKNAVPKVMEYSDEYGYTGTLFLDATSWEIHKYKNQLIETRLDRKVIEHEIIYSDVFKAAPYVTPKYMDTWMKDPINHSDSPWPREIQIAYSSQIAKNGNAQIVKYVNNLQNPYDFAEGFLQFQSLKYEQVALGDPKKSYLTNYRDTGVTYRSLTYGIHDLLKGDIYVNGHKLSGDTGLDIKRAQDMADMDEANTYSETVRRQMESLRQLLENEVDGQFKPLYEAKYNSTTDQYDYSAVNEFFSNNGPWPRVVEKEGAKSFYDETHDMISLADKGVGFGGDISIVVDDERTVLVQPGNELSDFYFEYKYKYICSTRGEESDTKYNIVANYGGTLIKTVKEFKQVPSEYKVTCEYTGIARKIWYDYDGMAYYRGAVTKGNSVGNVNPEDDNEILMFCDDEGYLRRPVTVYNEDGTPDIKNFYTVKADYVYITDVFKDSTPCYYKYNLQKPIYDYRGPDSNGFYSGNAIKVLNSSLRDIPENYKYKLKLEPYSYETVDVITDDFNIRQEQVPVEYCASLYTSFISGATDTFKGIYNSYDYNTGEINSGRTEEIFNYPFMVNNEDYRMEIVDPLSRLNKIQLTVPRIIEDTRHYVSFDYVVKAKRKAVLNTNGTVLKPEQEYTSHFIHATILNKDYAFKTELSNFEDRGYIISPKSENLYMTPMDICLQHQAYDGIDPIVHSTDTDLIFNAEIVSSSEIDVGAINLKCNPDGTGFITAETSMDTGFANEVTGKFDIMLDLDVPYYQEGNHIYPGIMVKCIDSRYIKVGAPREEKLLESWYPLIQFGHYSQVIDQGGVHTKVSYSMPEYDTQHFSERYKKPYVEVKLQEVKILNPHMVQTKCYPLFVKDNISETIQLYKKIDEELFEIKIDHVSFNDGIIVTIDTISENDLILCSYIYVEGYYVYRGYWRDKTDFVRIDLNPNIYHTYNDPTYVPSEVKPSKNLFNKVIYFYMKPSAVYEVKTDDVTYYDINPEEGEDVTAVLKIQNPDCLYHKIDDPEPDSNMDIYIGSVYIRQNTSLHSTLVIDSRTRGGGVLESISDNIRRELEPESDYYLDIGYYDGKPYQENGVIVVRLDQRLLKEFNGRFTKSEVEFKVKRWLGAGIYPIIEYVDSYSKNRLPQYNLEVEDTYTNMIGITPVLSLVCVEI